MGEKMRDERKGVKRKKKKWETRKIRRENKGYGKREKMRKKEKEEGK